MFWLRNKKNNFQLCTFIWGLAFHEQSNLVKIKSSGLEVLFQIISSSNYREADIKYINIQPPKMSFFLSIKH